MLLKSSIAGIVFAAVLGALAPAEAQTVMQQCGQQYQAAKAGGTLNGLTWNQFRTECAAKLKATPVSTTTAPAAPVTPAAAAPPPATEASPQTTAAPAAPAPTTPATSAAGKPVSAGRAAMLTREKQCGAEWRGEKATLIAQTPGLTWPKYWSACNKRLKAAAQ